MPKNSSRKPKCSRGLTALAVPLCLVLALALMALGALMLTGCGETDVRIDRDVGVARVEAHRLRRLLPGGGEPVLEVVGPDGTRAYTLEQIKAMKSTEGYGGMKSSTGRITPPTLVKGVLLDDLFAEVGGLPDDMAVSIVAKDGYEMTISVDAAERGRLPHLRHGHRGREARSTAR